MGDQLNRGCRSVVIIVGIVLATACNSNGSDSSTSLSRPDVAQLLADTPGVSVNGAPLEQGETREVGLEDEIVLGKDALGLLQVWGLDFDLLLNTSMRLVSSERLEVEAFLELGHLHVTLTEDTDARARLETATGVVLTTRQPETEFTVCQGPTGDTCLYVEAGQVEWESQGQTTTYDSGHGTFAVKGGQPEPASCMSDEAFAEWFDAAQHNETSDALEDRVDDAPPCTGGDNDSGQVSQTFTGHTDAVRTVAWSPDGTKIVSGGNDATVRVWDAVAGTELSEFTGHTGPVYGVTWSPDSTKVASASEDTTVRVWDVVTGTQLVDFDGHTNSVDDVAWSPDGSKIASTGETVRVWNADTGTQLVALSSYTSGVGTVAWSPDGTKLATGSPDKTVRVWDPNSGTQLGKPFTGHTGYVQTVAWSPDGSKIASASDDATVRVWDADSGTQLVELDGHTGEVFGVAWSPDGSKIASGGEDTTVRVWDPDSGAQIGEFTDHSGYVQIVAWSPDSTMIASASGDKTVRVWTP